MTAVVNDGVRHAVEVRFLGDFSLFIKGSPVERWRAGKARNLFQYLALRLGQTLTKDRLYEALWPDSPWPAGRSSLKVAVHALRRVVGAHPDHPGDSGIQLVSRDFGYALQIADLWADVDEFEELVYAGLRVSGEDGEVARARLRAALELYRGDFLQGETADWIVEQREYLKSLALRALAALRADAMGRQGFADLIDICRRTLEIDRHHEESYRALMAAHGSRGELGCVRSWYELCARRLRTELAVEPARETERLLHSLLSRAEAPASPDGPSMVRPRPHLSLPATIAS
ncbi:SARP family transcriptional regulator [Frankia canadensis]|uniref:SARP family transcriptional regulator n=2 Tax=Frankia canadensis TaxID=1836972 RepID=A0A2I2L269_9ACTN|nr:SARP family transcriptional regulator [Frankia canadensis]SOU59301.1 SARP family transcriptional regulator [Frankia canadensis]